MEVKRKMTPRIARRIAWSLVVAYFTLAAVGVALQAISNTTYVNTELPVIIILVVLVGVWIFIGALIISRHPQHPVGWLLCVGLFSPCIDMFAAGYAAYDTYVFSGSLPGVDLALVWLKLVNLDPLGLVAFTLMVLLFPDGRFPSPGWRKVAWTTVGMLLLILPLQALEPGPADPLFLPVRTNPLGVSASMWAFLKPLVWMAFSILVLCYGAAFVSLIVRLRNSRGDVRQQIKWLLFPAGLYGIFLLIFIVGMAEVDEGILGVSIALGQLAGACMVIASAFAIFRYRLYDVDLIINRTLVYGTLTASTMGLYIFVVGFLGNLFQLEDRSVIAFLTTGLVAIVFQPLRERLQRAINRLTFGDRDEPFEALERLGRRLEAVFSPEMVYPTIVETVAQALKLPYVAIALTRGEALEIAEAFGSTTHEPVTYPLLHQGVVVGQLMVSHRSPEEKFTAADERLLRSFARQAGTAVHVVQLTADLQRSRQNLVTAREEERLRLRRDLHDGLGPALASVIWQVDSARDIVPTNPADAVELLESSIDQAQAALADIRRLVYGLRPPALDELGLVGALEQAALKHQQTSFGANTTIDAVDPLPSLPAAVEVAAYRIIQEALKNAIEHGKAKNCLVCLTLGDNPADGGSAPGRLCLMIQDDGLGLPEVVNPGIGLVSMRERAEELGGTFAIHPRQTGGTEVEVCLPFK